MRLSVSRSANSTSLYVIKSTYEDKKHSTKIVEKLGTISELEKKLNGEDPIEWANKYIAELNRKQKEENSEVLVKYSPRKTIPKGQRRSFNGGYLFLQKIYHELSLDSICRDISGKYKFDFDLNDILSRLVYSRIIFPSSKHATYTLSKDFLEQPNFDLHQIYRALEIIAKEMKLKKTELYKNSLKIFSRKTGVLYYDCTNYFFEIEQDEGLKQYGHSKEHKPNPVVQMGLFMDADGIPLAFNINNGNTNEQLTLKPLEKKILSDFELSKFVVCTDAGLASASNRKFNDKGDRGFITTQSVKKLKKHLKEWALDPKGWCLSGSKKIYEMEDLENNETNKEKRFYKERWIKEDGLEQKLIVTYCLKYRDYQRKIRNSQILRAGNALNSSHSKLEKINQNDYKRFIKKTHVTSDGEVAQKSVYSINEEIIAKEEIFDGFYAVCTNLEDDPYAIIKVNRRRWQIEECFRILKSEFKARPVYLSRDDRIRAHFTTCFISLMIFRLLEKKLNGEYTCSNIVDGLRTMNFCKIKGDGYIPSYTRTDLTDALHDAFGFRTDYEIVTNKMMKNIFKETKK